MAYSKALHDTIDLEPYLVSHLGSGHEDYKALNSGYAISLTGCVFNLGIIFGANRHWSGGGRIIFITSKHFFTSFSEKLE